MTSPAGRNPPTAGAGAAVELSTWATWREARAVLARPQHLRRTAAIALVVGTILFCINQLDVVLGGEADAIVWIKVAVTYLVPFCVSCAGVLVGTRRPRGPGRPTPRLKSTSTETPHDTVAEGDAGRNTKSAHFRPDPDSQTAVNGASYVGRERNGAISSTEPGWTVLIPT